MYNLCCENCAYFRRTRPINFEGLKFDGMCDHHEEPTWRDDLCCDFHVRKWIVSAQALEAYRNHRQ